MKNQNCARPISAPGTPGQPPSAQRTKQQVNSAQLQSIMDMICIPQCPPPMFNVPATSTGNHELPPGMFLVPEMPLGMQMNMQPVGVPLVKETVLIPSYLHVLIFGPRWVHVEQMMRKHNVNIYASDYNAPSDQVFVEGHPDAVAATMTHLSDVVRLLQQHVRFTVVDLERRHCAKVVGHHGCKLFKLLARHWISIIIPEPDDSGHQGIVICGLEAHCCAARNDLHQQIYGTAQAVPDQSASGPLHQSLHVQLDSHQLSIIKRHRHQIDLMVQRNYGVRMTLTNGTQLVVLKGAGGDQCRQAQRHILDMFRVEQCVVVPPEMRSVIVGKNGKSIRKMSAHYGVIISVPMQKDQSDDVLISGPHQDNVDQACAALLQRVQQIRLAQPDYPPLQC